jgi:hypothetical protein
MFCPTPASYICMPRWCAKRHDTPAAVPGLPPPTTTSITTAAAALPALPAALRTRPPTHPSQALVSLAVLAPRPWDYYMHADDDSYVRLDLLLPLLVSGGTGVGGWVGWGARAACRLFMRSGGQGGTLDGGAGMVKCIPNTLNKKRAPCVGGGQQWWLLLTWAPLLALQASAPRTRFYWGYIWDGTGNRATAPIRNPRNKSYMPEEQVGLDALRAGEEGGVLRRGRVAWRGACSTRRMLPLVP